MAMIFLSDGDRAGRRSVKVFSTIHGARIGRWCQAEAERVSRPLRLHFGRLDQRRRDAFHDSIRHGQRKKCRVPARPLREMCLSVRPRAQAASHSLTVRVRKALESPVRSSHTTLECLTGPATSRSNSDATSDRAAYLI
jgi:hypothetical protein